MGTAKFSNVYDELRTRITSALTTHSELNNPYILSDDADLNFDRAWTLAIGASENTNRILCNTTTVRRDFILILAERFFATDRDITTRITSEKSLLNYQLDVINSFEASPGTSNIVKIDYLSDNGIEFLDGDRWGFLILQTILSVEYFENY